MNNQFATLDPFGTNKRIVRVRNHGRPNHLLLGVVTWERYIEIGDLRLRIINRPGNHDQYQARLTCGGKSYGKIWRIRKDSPRIGEWLEGIKKAVL